MLAAAGGGLLADGRVEIEARALGVNSGRRGGTSTSRTFQSPVFPPPLTRLSKPGGNWPEANSPRSNVSSAGRAEAAVKIHTPTAMQTDGKTRLNMVFNRNKIPRKRKRGGCVLIGLRHSTLIVSYFKSNGSGWAMRLLTICR